MPPAGSVATVIVACSVSLFMAWTIGAGSSGSTPFAPAVGAKAISIMRAAFLVGLLGFAGAMVQGASVSETVGSGLIRGVALGGVPAWAKYQEIVSLWVLTPFVGGGIAYATARILRSDRLADARVIPLLGAVTGTLLVHARFVFLGTPGESASFAVVGGTVLASRFTVSSTMATALVTALVAVLVRSLVWHRMRQNGDATKRQFLLVLGGLVAFSAGGTQVGFAVGPLLPLLGDYPVPTVAALVLGATGLLVGSWTGAPRMIKALSQDYSSLGPQRSIAALLPSFAIAQTAVFFGIPVSFNEIIVSAIVGSGYAATNATVSGGKFGRTVLAWIGSFVAATAGGYVLFGVVVAVR